MALTDFLKQIADSIRSKDGTTEPIVASTFPQRILDIPSGGGSSGPFTIHEGEFMLSADHILYDGTTENNLIINHNLGKKPDMFIVYSDPDVTPVHIIHTITIAWCMLPVYAMAANGGIRQLKGIMRVNGSGNVTGFANYTNPNNTESFFDFTDNSVIIGKGINSANAIFRSGNLYRWLAFFKN